MNRFYLSESRFALSVGLLIVLGIVSAFVIRHLVTQYVLETNAANLSSQAAIRASILQRGFKNGSAHTEFLALTPPIKGMIRASKNNNFDEREKTPYAFWKRRLETIFSAYVAVNANIAQIRFIGMADGGLELVRVERANKQVLVVAEENLQRKASRDYFKETQNLQPGELYVSSLNLNREFDRIDEPLWPTFRIATPVYDGSKEVFGILIVNFDARSLLDSILDSENSELDIFLLNEAGNYLVSPDKEKEFAFEYGDSTGWFDEKGGAEEEETGRLPSIVFSSNGQKYWYKLHRVVCESSANVPTLFVIAALKDSVINGQVYQRQSLTMLAFSILIGFAILLLFFYRKFSEKTLREIKLKAEFEAIVSGTSDAIVSTDEYGVIHSWNQAALRIFRRSEEQVRAKKLVQLFGDPVSIEKISEAIDKLSNKRQINNFDVELKFGNGDTSQLSVALSPIYMNSPRISGFSTIFHDVSHARQLQTSLEMINVELHNRNAEMERFIYTVSHDLKSPLVTIGGFSRLLLDSAGEALDSKNRHRLGRIIYNVEQMAELLDELLHISRVIQQELETVECNVDECGKEACEALNQAILSSDAEIAIDAKLPIIRANRRLFVQCLQNLLANAIAHRDPSCAPKIEVLSGQQEAFHCVAVKDNGIGIDAKNHEQIFRLFERLDFGQGNGVGLAIVKTVMEKHKGWVKLDSSPGVGSTFTLGFPSKD